MSEQLNHSSEASSKGAAAAPTPSAEAEIARLREAITAVVRENHSATKGIVALHILAMEWATRPAPSAVAPAEAERKDAMHEAGFQAGLKAGWNMCVAGDNEGYARRTSSSEHIGILRAGSAVAAPDGPITESWLRELEKFVAGLTPMTAYGLVGTRDVDQARNRAAVEAALSHIDAGIRALASRAAPEGVPGELLEQVLDALRLGRVALEWSEKHEEVAKVRAASDALRAIAARTSTPLSRLSGITCGTGDHAVSS